MSRIFYMRPAEWREIVKIKLPAGSFVWYEWLTRRNTADAKSTRVVLVNELCFVAHGIFFYHSNVCLPTVSLTASLDCEELLWWSPFCFLLCSGVGTMKGRFIYCLVESVWLQFHKQIGLQLRVLCHK